MSQIDELGFGQHEGDLPVEIPDEVPVLPLFSVVVYPGTIVPLAVGQEQSIQLIDQASAGQQVIALVALKAEDARPDPVRSDDFYRVGTAALVHKLMRLPDGTLRVAVQGLERITIEEITAEQPFFRARVRVSADEVDESVETEALMRAIAGEVTQIAPLIPNFPEELLQAVLSEENPRRLAYLVASYIRVGVGDRQTILELSQAREKLLRLSEILARELQVLKIGQQIQSQVESELTKTQREYVLREQLKAIRKELGDEDENEATLERLERAIQKAGMTEEARRQATSELDRLRAMPPAAAEYGVIHTYLELLTSLPWKKRSKDQIDIRNARRVLDEDHYDLEEIKERILEFLAVRELRQIRQPGNEGRRGAILCFVGPPGVGKTSLGRSIARAMGREFIRASLGGVHDEAEIRGHRRTYIGAMPGTVIQAIRRAGTNNPVFMLDEIDKIGQDFRGDPTSALLEVLDPEQNSSFRDHYLEVAWDLSPVLFIATANQLDPIPEPLRDRLEIIQLSGYTAREKLEIARRYLVPQQLSEHALTYDDLVFTDAALLTIIDEYTREAGVRSLERQIAAVCRKVARQIAEVLPERQESVAGEPIVVDPERARAYLGRQRFFPELAERHDRPGVVTGLVYTPAGGDIIFLEATTMPGEGDFLITGQLGDVMKESARAALSWVRSESQRLGIEPELFRRSDLHLHVPAGAIPKDGPSAGVAMATALASLLTGRPVQYDLAMTGEITLRGRVLPVGGIKEKVLAAHRAGVKTVILPQRNQRDLDEIPDELRETLQFIFVERVEEVLEAALCPRRETVDGGNEELGR